MNKLSLLEQLLATNRSVRRFDRSKKISAGLLERLIGLTRLCASGRNLQPLRYRLVTDNDECADVFRTLSWAGYYRNWPGPSEKERPVAYIVQCLDTRICPDCLCDDGLQLEAITLGATAAGASCCIIKAFNGPALSEILRLPAFYTPRYVVAMGYAAERVKLVDLGEDGDIRYYRDENDAQCVPKRQISELLIRP